MDQLRDGVTTARYLYENGVISKGTLEEVHRQYNYAELNPSETGNQNVSRHVADLIVTSITPQQTQLQTQNATDQKLNEEISKLRYEKIKEYDRGYSAAIASIKLKVQSPQLIDLKKMEGLIIENTKLRHELEELKKNLEQLQGQTQQDMTIISQHALEMQTLREQYKTDVETLTKQHAAEIQTQIKIANSSITPQAQIDNTSELIVLREQIKSLQVQLKQAEAERVSIKAQVEQAKVEIETLNSKNATLSNENTGLSEALESLRTEKSEDEPEFNLPREGIQQSPIVDLNFEARYEELSKQLTQLGEAKAKAEIALEQLIRQLEIHEGDNVSLIMPKLRSVVIIKGAGIVDTVNAVVDELLTVRKNVRDVAEYERSLTELRNAMFMADKRVKELQDFVDIYETAIDKGYNIITINNLESNYLDKRKRDVQSIIDWREAKERYPKEKAELDREKNAFEQQKTAINEEINKLKAENATIGALRQEIAKLNTLINKKEQEHDQAMIALNNNIHERIDRAVQNAKETVIQPNVRQIMDENSQLQQINQQLREEKQNQKDSFEQQLESLRTELFELKEIKSDLDRLKAEKQREKEMLEQKINEQKTTYDLRITELERQITVLTEKMRPLVEENIKLKEENRLYANAVRKLNTKLTNPTPAQIKDIKTVINGDEDEITGDDLDKAIPEIPPTINTGIPTKIATGRIPNETIISGDTLSRLSRVSQGVVGGQSQSQSQAILILVAVVVIIVLLFIAIVLPSEKVKPHIDISNGGVGGNCSSSPASYYSHTQRNFI